VVLPAAGCLSAAAPTSRHHSRRLAFFSSRTPAFAAHALRMRS
jgi:hypothetical protein